LLTGYKINKQYVDRIK